MSEESLEEACGESPSALSASEFCLIVPASTNRASREVSLLRPGRHFNRIFESTHDFSGRSCSCTAFTKGRVISRKCFGSSSEYNRILGVTKCVSYLNSPQTQRRHRNRCHGPIISLAHLRYPSPVPSNFCNGCTVVIINAIKETISAESATLSVRPIANASTKSDCSSGKRRLEEGKCSQGGSTRDKLIGEEMEDQMNAVERVLLVDRSRRHLGELF